MKDETVLLGLIPFNYKFIKDEDFFKFVSYNYSFSSGFFSKGFNFLSRKPWAFSFSLTFLGGSFLKVPSNPLVSLNCEICKKMGSSFMSGLILLRGNSWMVYLVSSITFSFSYDSVIVFSCYETVSYLSLHFWISASIESFS